MSAADEWLERYARDHDHPLDRLLHGFSIPLVVVGAVGLLWSVPVPAAFAASGIVNWGTIFLMAAVVYYFIVSITLALGMLPFVVLVAVAVGRLNGLATPLWVMSAAALGVAAAGQLLGHMLERKPASVLRDLNFVMIGPLWLLAGLYRRLHIPY